MTGGPKPVGAATRRAVTRIFGAADSLPERSKASKVLTTVACRLQLFVYELERARFEHFGLGIEQLLERLHEHGQLLGVASVQGGGIQSGYALLSELLELLQELEASVLLLPEQLGGDARYKPALDELQALLANVSYYRSECEETKRRMEAALSELVQGCPVRVLEQDTVQATSSEGSKTPVIATAPGSPTAVAGAAGGNSTYGDDASPGSRSSSFQSGGEGHAAVRPCSYSNSISAEHGGAGAEVAVLQRVRQVIFELDLDVEMAEGVKDLDAELLLLRDQMQQELQQQLQQQRLLQKKQLQSQDPYVELYDPDPHVQNVEQSTLLRSGARKRREGPGDHGAAAGAFESPRAPPLLSPASSPTATPYGTVASRLHATRHVSRRLAAQHLARLKEQQRQLRLQIAVAAAAAGTVTGPCSPSNRAAACGGSGLGAASGAGGVPGKGVEEDSGDEFTVQPAARRRRMAAMEEKSTGTDLALGSTAPAAAAGSAKGTEAKLLPKSPSGKATTGAAGVKGTAGAAEGHSREETAITVSDQATASEVNGRDRADAPSASEEAVASEPASRPLGSMRLGTAETDSDPQGNALDSGNGLPCPERSCASTSDSECAVGAAPGILCGGESDGSSLSLPKGFVTRCSGGACGNSGNTSDSEVSSDGSVGVPHQRPREASVAALRKLNRVTALAGMWEAGRLVAQQGTAEAFTANGDSRHANESISGSASDCEDRSDGCASDTSNGGCELPARPAARHRAPPVAAILTGLDKGATSNSPFVMLALQGGPMKASQRPVLGRLLASPPEHESTLDDVPASPAASVQGHAPGLEAASLPQSPTVAAGIAQPGCLRIRGAGAATAAAAAAPAPLPLPDASVHLRAVGLPGCFVPHWAPPGPCGIPPAIHPGAGLWLAGVGGGGNGGLNGGEGDGGSGGSGGANGGGSGGGAELLDFGPDVPTLDLHRDITGWGPCLGRGAFGAVYKALFRNKPAAIKVLHGGALDVRDMRALRMEISLLCRLRHHPNIITVYGAAAAPPDRIALVTELMDCDLYDYIHRRRQNCVPMDEVLSIARAIASGLSELHPAIVHRDLKPANVLLRHSAPSQGGPGSAATQQQLDRRLTVKIADFGLARHKRSQYLSTRDRDAGTLKYMAPECIASGIGGGGGRGGGGGGGGGSRNVRREGGEADGSCRSASSGDGSVSGSGTSCGGITEKCDIYSFGVLLYELITGREPWEGCHPLYAMCQVQSGVTLQLPDDPDRCPPALRALVQRCWSYPHQKRPNSRELLQELDGIIAERQLQLAEERGGSGGGAGGACGTAVGPEVYAAALGPSWH